MPGLLSPLFALDPPPAEHPPLHQERRRGEYAHRHLDRPGWHQAEAAVLISLAAVAAVGVLIVGSIGYALWHAVGWAAGVVS